MQAETHADIGGAESRAQEKIPLTQGRLQYLHGFFQPTSFQFGDYRRAIRRRDENTLLYERRRMDRNGFAVVNPLQPFIPLGVSVEPAQAGLRIALA